MKVRLAPEMARSGKSSELRPKLSATSGPTWRVPIWVVPLPETTAVPKTVDPKLVWMG